MHYLFMSFFVMLILVGVGCMAIVARSIWTRERDAATRRFVALTVGVACLTLGVAGLERGEVPVRLGFWTSIVITLAALFHLQVMRRQRSSQ